MTVEITVRREKLLTRLPILSAVFSLQVSISSLMPSSKKKVLYSSSVPLWESLTRISDAWFSTPSTDSISFSVIKAYLLISIELISKIPLTLYSFITPLLKVTSILSPTLTPPRLEPPVSSPSLPVISIPNRISLVFSLPRYSPAINPEWNLVTISSSDGSIEWTNPLFNLLL